jgi:hypothetical protein
MRVLSCGSLAVSVFVLAACAGVGSPASHAQEAASSIAENERFGRIELVLERVDPEAKADFVRTHAGWGGRLTIADTEFGNFKMIGKDDAEINLRVTWYDVADQELRSTMLKQHWHGKEGNWLLTSESRVDGDMGLLGEKVVVQAPEQAPQHAQFATVKIGSVD